MIDLRPILQVIGMLLSILAVTMLIPAAVDLAYFHRESLGFVGSAVITGFAGALLWLGNRGHSRSELNLRQVFLLTVLTWLVISVFASLPMMFGHSRLSPVDALFETMSGLTTTGATVITGLDYMPAGLLLWRMLLHAMGAVGIIVVALALLPMLRVGGMQLFRAEFSDKDKKLLPSTGQLALAITSVFAALVSLCTLAYLFGGMTLLDAVCHAISTVGTGGFANYDSSIAVFDSPFLETVAITFMLAGALPFTVYVALTSRKLTLKALPSLFDGQIRWFLIFCATISLVMSAWLYFNSHFSLGGALRHGTFNVISAITTTGFVSADYLQWGGGATMVFFALYFVGGCTGSTTGSVKVFRYQVLFQAIRRILFRMVNPHGVMRLRLNETTVSEETLTSVIAFMFLFFVTMFVIATGLSLTGVDFMTALTASAATISNVGPGLGEIAGPASNYGEFSDAAKLMMCAGMLLGRLELFTVFVLLTPRFWRV
ncbi:MAG: TrkH family potassium uptake protein [Sphingomonadales bacterium]